MSGGVNNAFNEEGIIFGIAFIAKVRECTELRASRGHVHVRGGSLEAGALWCWFEALGNVLTTILVDQDKGHLVLEWPLEQSIKLTLHKNKEEREVCLVSHSITIKEGLNTHLVAKLSSMERWAIQ